MKKCLALLLAMMMCFSLVSCGGEVTDMVVGGENTTVSDFLITMLREYMESDGYLARKQIFEDSFGYAARDLTVTKVIEIVADNLGENQISVHFLAIKADCDYGTENGFFANILLVVDYETGKMYDEFTVDPDWFTMDGTKEQAIAYMLNGPLVGDGYKGGTIIVKSEERTELSKKDIAVINEAIACVDESTDLNGQSKSLKTEYYEEGAVKVYSFTADKMENGRVDCVLEYTAPARRHIAIFNPPDGDLFMYMPENKTTGEKSTLTFTIESEHVNLIEEITVNFYATGNENDFIVLKFFDVSDDEDNTEIKEEEMYTMYKGKICLSEEQMMRCAKVIELTAENWRDYFTIETNTDNKGEYATILLNTGDSFAYVWYNDTNHRYNDITFRNRNSGKTESVHFGMADSTRKYYLNFDELDFVESTGKLVLFDVPETCWSMDVDGTPYIYFGSVTQSGAVTTFRGCRINQNDMADHIDMMDMLKKYFPQDEIIDVPKETEETTSTSDVQEEPKETTIPLTLENWQEYFELGAYVSGVNYNGFGEFESLRTNFSFFLKADIADKVTKIENLVFEVALRDGYFTWYEYNLETGELLQKQAASADEVTSYHQVSDYQGVRTPATNVKAYGAFVRTMMFKLSESVSGDRYTFIGDAFRTMEITRIMGDLTVVGEISTNNSNENKEDNTVTLTTDNWNQYFEFRPTTYGALYDSFGEFQRLDYVHWALFLKDEVKDKVTQIKDMAIEYDFRNGYFSWYEYNFDTKELVQKNAAADGEVPSYQQVINSCRDLPVTLASVSDKGCFLVFINSHYSESINGQIYSFIGEAFGMMEITRIKGTIIFE